MQAVTTKDDVLCVGSSASVTVGHSSSPKGKSAVLWHEQAELSHPLDVLFLSRAPVRGRASAACLLISVLHCPCAFHLGWRVAEVETEAQQQAWPPWRIRGELLLVNGLA